MKKCFCVFCCGTRKAFLLKYMQMFTTTYFIADLKMRWKQAASEFVDKHIESEKTLICVDEGMTAVFKDNFSENLKFQSSCNFENLLIYFR